jgi:integrase
MAVYDRWHRAPQPGDEPCREHSRGRTRLYPSAVHGQGDRWQVRYYNENGKQRKRNFRLREGRNPDLHADAYDAKITRELHTGDYVDPDLAEVTLQAYAEEWRKARTHDTVSAGHLERRLRLHVYQDPDNPGRTPKGGTSIGQRRMRELARRPSLLQAWVASMPLAASSARVVIADVAAVFRAAADDGIVARNPLRSASVGRPPRAARRARPWTREQVAAMSAALPARYAVVPWLGAGTGMRQGELFGLAAEDVTFLGRDPRVKAVRQVKIVDGRLHFAPTKNRKARSVPLAPGVALRLARHMELYPPAEVTLPWHDLKDRRLHGTMVTVRLVLSRPDGRALDRNAFNPQVWRPAVAKAGIEGGRDSGCHALRHTAASAWLRSGIDVVRVAAWLGDAPQMVLGTYAHMMPGDDDADGRAAVDAFFGGQGAPDMPHEEAL